MFTVGEAFRAQISRNLDLLCMEQNRIESFDEESVPMCEADPQTGDALRSESAP